jgi:hypothetical protein
MTHKIGCVQHDCEACATQAAELRRLQAENDELRTDAECFRFWVHEAWHSPADMARLLCRCETKQDYIDAIIPMIEASRAAIDAARAKEQTP